MALIAEDRRPHRVRAALLAREVELGRLAGFARDAADGEPVIACLRGEEGIGKTALLDELLDQVQAHRVLRVNGDVGERSVGWSGVERLVLEWLPTLGRDLSLRRVVDGGNGSVRRGQGPLHAPHSVGAEVARHLRTESREGLVVVAIDDADVLDDVSAAAIAHALRRLGRSRVFCVLTMTQPERYDTPLGRGIDEGIPAHRIDLPGLPRGALQELLLAARNTPLSPLTLLRLSEQTGGNPRLALALIDESGSRGLTAASHLLPAPSFVSRILSDALEGCSDPARALAEAVAVIGSPCPRSVAAQVAGVDEGTDTELVEAGIIERVGAEPAMLSFSRPMARNAVYATISEPQRRALHEAAAKQMSGLVSLTHRIRAVAGKDEDLAAEAEQMSVERYFAGLGAGTDGLLLDAALVTPPGAERDRRIAMAALLAVQNGNHVTSDAYLEHLQELPFDAWQQTLIGTIAFIRGRAAQAEPWLRKVVEEQVPSRYPMFDAFVRPELVAAITLANSALLDFEPERACRILEEHGLGVSDVADSEATLGSKMTASDGEGSGVAALAILRASGLASAIREIAAAQAATSFTWISPKNEPIEYHHAGATSLRDFRIERATARALRRLWDGELQDAFSSLGALGSLLDPGESSFLPLVALSAEAALRLGNLRQALALGRRTVFACSESGNHVPLAIGAGTMAIASDLMGDERESSWWSGRARVAAVAAGNRSSLAAVLFADVNRALRENIASADVVDSACELADATCTLHPGLLLCPAPDVAVLASVGELEEASARLRRWEDRAAEVPGAWARLWISRLRAMVESQRRPDYPGAWQPQFRESAQAARACGATFEYARTLRLWGLAEVASGREAQGARRLEEALQGFDQIGAAREAAWIRSHQSGLTQRASRLESLSEREREIALMVAGGLTNREVAQRLHVSSKTVEGSLTRTYAKLGLRSKLELAALLAAADDTTSSATVARLVET